MEGDITAVVQPLHLVAHVLEQKLVLVQVHLQPPPQKPQQELHAESRDHPLVTEHSHSETDHNDSLGVLLAQQRSPQLALKS